MMRGRKMKVTCNSTCGSLHLPQDLACIWCKPSIVRSLHKGVTPRNIKSVFNLELKRGQIIVELKK